MERWDVRHPHDEEGRCHQRKLFLHPGSCLTIVVNVRKIVMVMRSVSSLWGVSHAPHLEFCIVFNKILLFYHPCKGVNRLKKSE